MKKIITLLYLLCHLSQLSQTFVTPTDILIKKNRVKKITSKLVDSLETDQSKRPIRGIWEYDSTGKLIHEQGYLGRTTYHYNDDGLIRERIILGRQTDTVTYRYDENGRLLNYSYRKYEGYPLTLSSIYNYQYEYPNEKMMVLRTETVNKYHFNRPEFDFDTTFYNKRKLPASEVSTKHGTKKYYSYNRRRQLALKIERTKSPDYYKKTRFIYRKTRINSEEESYIDGKFVQSKKSFQYFYSRNGLVKYIMITYKMYGKKYGGKNSEKRTYQIFDYEYY